MHRTPTKSLITANCCTENIPIAKTVPLCPLLVRTDTQSGPYDLPEEVNEEIGDGKYPPSG